MREVIIQSERDTEKFGMELAESLVAGDVLALMGDLGAGKTTLTKYIAKGLGVKETVTSPTFTIVNEYLSGRLPLFHFDAYRLGGEQSSNTPVDAYRLGGEQSSNVPDSGDELKDQIRDAVFETGIEEYFYRGGICIVEWAEFIESILPDNTKCIFIEYLPGGESEEGRLYRCTF